MNFPARHLSGRRMVCLHRRCKGRHHRGRYTSGLDMIADKTQYRYRRPSFVSGEGLSQRSPLHSLSRSEEGLRFSSHSLEYGSTPCNLLCKVNKFSRADAQKLFHSTHPQACEWISPFQCHPGFYLIQKERNQRYQQTQVLPEAHRMFFCGLIDFA